MKMTIKRRLGATQVVGGRILQVTHDHLVSTKGYDGRIDRMEMLPPPSDPDLPATQPFKPRSFDHGWETALVGDLAIEVIGVKTSRVMAYVYLSGRAISIFRHVCDQDRNQVAGWFSEGKGLRFEEVDPSISPTALVNGMMGLKYSGADIAACRLRVKDIRDAQYAGAAFATAYSYGCDELEATTDVVFGFDLARGKETCVVHFQALKRAQEYAIQPFIVDLVLSSPHLSPVNFREIRAPS